jgi:hypothetical protein
VFGQPEQVVKSGCAKAGDNADNGAKKEKRSKVYKVAAKCEHVTKGMVCHYESFAVRTLEGFLPTPAMSDLGQSPTSLTRFASLHSARHPHSQRLRGSLPHHINTGGERRRVGSTAS